MILIVRLVYRLLIYVKELSWSLFNDSLDFCSVGHEIRVSFLNTTEIHRNVLSRPWLSRFTTTFLASEGISRNPASLDCI